MQTALAEAETTSIEIASVETAYAKAATAPAHSPVAPTMVPKIEVSHKDYLTIFSQTMNLMPNIFLQVKDLISDDVI